MYVPGEQAAEYGIKLTMKPHVGTAIYSQATILKAAQGLNLDQIGFNYDPSHIWRSGPDAVASCVRCLPIVFC